MAMQIDFLGYEKPNIEFIVFYSEGMLCSSITSGTDDLEPGEDWGGLL